MEDINRFVCLVPGMWPHDNDDDDDDDDDNDDDDDDDVHSNKLTISKTNQDFRIYI